MALIKCKNCGNFISDKAKACPKCGAPNIPSSTETNEDAKSQTDERINPNYAINPETDSPQQEDYYYDPDQAPKQSHKKLYIILAILIIVIAGGIGYYFYAQHQVELKESRIEAERIEQMRQDSIEAARIEAARLDSIRQDSIFRNFTSNDLRVFELHGKVKDVKYISENTIVGQKYVNPIGNIFKINYFNFDENGVLKHKQESFDLRKPDGQNLLGWKYNNNGYPTDGRFSEDGGYETEYWRWHPDGQLKEAYDSYGAHFSSIKFKYDENGYLVSVNYLERANSGVEVTGTITVKIEETDKWDNWIKRRITINVKDQYEAIDEYHQPNPGYKMIDQGGYYLCQKNYTKTFTEQRTITYYGTNEK